MTTRPDVNEAAAMDFDAAVSVTDRPSWCESWRAEFDVSSDRVELDAVTLPPDPQLRAALVDHYDGGGVIRMGVGTIPL